MSSAAKKAVVLVSGGLDSTTTLAQAKAWGYDVYALTIDYGQKHRYELIAAEQICQHYQVNRQVVLKLDLSVFEGSALTSNIAVPKLRDVQQMEAAIPVTYVPARNTVFLSVALGWAESLGASDIFIGVNAVDYSGYPDCRPEFITAFTKLAQLATKNGVEQTASWNIHTPLIKLTKAEIIKLGLSLGVDYSLTHTCYDPLAAGQPCGECDACILRIRGFQALGEVDPLVYPQHTKS